MAAIRDADLTIEAVADTADQYWCTVGYEIEYPEAETGALVCEVVSFVRGGHDVASLTSTAWPLPEEPTLDEERKVRRLRRSTGRVKLSAEVLGGDSAKVTARVELVPPPTPVATSEPVTVPADGGDA